MLVAIPTKDCLELIYELLLPVLNARGEQKLTQQEVLSLSLSQHKLKLGFRET